MYNCTVLCVVDDTDCSSPVVSSLQAAGCEVLTVANTLHASAIAFVNRRIDAVVLDTKSSETSLRVARAIKSVRAALPILLVSCNMGPDLPPYVDACVCARDDDEIVVKVLTSLVGKLATGPIPEFTAGLRPGH